MDEPEIRIAIKVTLVSKDGFFSVTEFTPELWEHDRKMALQFAHQEHALAREASLDEGGRHL